MRIEKLFRLVGALEGTSFLLLLGIGMPLKYLAGIPVATQVLGMIHGILFILFCLCLFVIVRAYSLSIKVGLIGFVAACLPFGPFFFDHYLRPQIEPCDGHE